MAATHTTRTITNSYGTALNSSAAAGAVSVYPIDGGIWLNVSATTSAPTDDLGAIYLGPSQAGSGIINQTLAALWPGFTSPAYLFARTDSAASGRVVVSCA